MGRQLKFKQDGSFKIVQFTDVHWTDGSEPDRRTSALMKRILAEERPDLVVLTGDMVCGKENALLMRMAIQPVNEANVPWAAVFGNHDAEEGAGKDVLLGIQQESSLCLSEAGESDISGIGNYNLEITRSSTEKPAWVLFFFDSGNMNPNSIVGGYDYIKRDQIDWYARQSGRIAIEAGKLPALAFLHIPLPEYDEVWHTETCFGEKNEEVCCPGQNSGLFSAMLEMGDVKGVFVGHDHINDYCGDLHGIKLCYGRATGYNTYGVEGFARGARVIRLMEGQKNFKTWIRLEDGSVVRNAVIHEPKGHS